MVLGDSQFSTSLLSSSAMLGFGLLGFYSAAVLV